MNRDRRRDGVLVGAIAALLGGVALLAAQPPTGIVGQASSGAGVAEIKNAGGEIVATARFTPTPHGVLLRLDIENLAAGEHAIHIHEVGRCEAPEFASAGEHMSQGRQHGFLDPKGAHPGDLPNLHMPTVKTTVEHLIDNVTLEAGVNALLDNDGAALVIHASPDDYQTEPGGSAGDRIACGVIEKV